MAATDSDNTTPHKRCLGCGYILDGLPENRCPECARPFDPGDSDTFWIEERVTKVLSGRALLAGSVVATLAMAAPLFVFKLVRLPTVARLSIDVLLIVATTLVGLAAQFRILRDCNRVLHDTGCDAPYPKLAVVARVTSVAAILIFTVILVVVLARALG